MTNTNTKAWNGLGHDLSAADTVKEAWKLAYPYSLHMMDLEASFKSEGGETHKIPVENKKIIYRSDGVEFDTVSPTFEMVQPHAFFNAYRSFLEKGHAKLVAGGSLKGGRIIWGLAELKDGEADILSGDSVKAHLLMLGGLDGCMSIKALFSTIRPVCENQLSSINRQVKESGLSFRHTKNVHSKLDGIEADVDIKRQQFRSNVEAYQHIAKKQFTTKVLHEYMLDVFAPNIDAEELSRKPATLTKIERCIELVETQRGLDLVPAARGTMWAAYNAVSEYVTHEHGTTEDTRLQGQWFGESSKVNKRALQLAVSNNY